MMWDQSTAQIDRVFLFGPFRLSPRQRLVLENGKPVRLGSRAIEMLVVLIEKTGELVGKDELIARVWPRTVVVAANLTSQMTALRRALHDGRDGNRYIVNESGRGYRFVASVTTVDQPEFAPPATPPAFEHASPSLMRMVELCHSFIGRPHNEPPSQQMPSPQGEPAMVDAILQRGIQALEFARTLVSAPDQPEGSGLGLAHYASRWVETGLPAASL
jgi:DNA-binding winged helix-turn-helix (wHTH) protein